MTRTVALLKSGDYGDWARGHEGLPYRIDLLESRDLELRYTDRHLHGAFARPRAARAIGAIERALVPMAQTAILFPEIRSAAVALAMFESEGHFLGALRYLRAPGSRRPAYGVISCWLAALLPSASHRKLAWYRRLYRHVDRLFVLSSQQVAPVAEALGLPSSRVRFVHFGIDHEAFAPALASEGDYVLAAGRDRGRDWRTLFLAAEHLSMPVKVLARPSDLIGLVPPPNLEVLGYRSFDEYRQLLLGARAVVIATHERPYPTGQTVLLEAMAGGKAAVITRTEAMSDYLDGENCLTVPTADPVALAEAVQQEYDDADLRAAMGVAARRFVESTANAARMWRIVEDEMLSVRP